MLAAHTTLAAVAGALPYAAVAANFGDDALTAYAAATGDPYAQEQAIMAQQMAMADGGSPLFDGLGGLLGAAKLGRRSLADPDPNLPRMLSVNDDFLVTGGDYIIALGALLWRGLLSYRCGRFPNRATPSLPFSSHC